MKLLSASLGLLALCANALLAPASALAAGTADRKVIIDVPQQQPAAPAKPAPYDDKLSELAEIMGSLDFIRNLCGTQQEPQWKSMASQLIETEAKDEPERKARLTAAFNRGYRTFGAIQTSCNPQLRATADKYRIAGATLATEITARFGN